MSPVSSTPDIQTFNPLTKDGGEVSANYAVQMAQFIEDKGLCTATFWRLSGIDENLAQDPDASITTVQYAHLIQICLDLTNNPYIGLEYGQRLNISTHGLLGFAVMSSPSLEKAAELAINYVKIRNQLINIDFKMLTQANNNEPLASLCFDVPLAHEPQYRFEIETSVSSLFAIWRELQGSSTGVSAIHFSYAAPDDMSAYTTVFDVPVLFNCDENAMCFSPLAFERMSRVTDPMLSRVAEQQCKKLLQQQSREQEKTLSYAVRALLLNDHALLLNQQQVAKALGVSSRTLSRRLAKEGITFKVILDELRQQLALQYLHTTQYSVDEIAHLLNYSDAANFSRAVKRWTGLTPKQYRLDKEQSV